MFSTSFIRRTLRSSGVRALKPASGAARCFHASQAAYLSSPPSDVADATPAAAASSEVRENVLNAYRKLLTMAKIMPDCKKRADTLTQIRTQFRRNSGEASAETVDQMLRKANSSLGFLNIISPKRNRAGQEGKTTLVFGTNKDGTTSSTATSNWHGGNMDPDNVARHSHQLKRAGFRDNAHAKGVF